MTCCIEHIEKCHLFVNDTLLAVRICSSVNIIQMALTEGSMKASGVVQPTRRYVGVIQPRGIYEVLRTFNGGIIFVDKVALDELDCEARLADATSANDDKLIFS